MLFLNIVVCTHIKIASYTRNYKICASVRCTYMSVDMNAMFSADTVCQCLIAMSTVLQQFSSTDRHAISEYC